MSFKLVICFHTLNTNKSNTSSWFCKMTRRFSKHWVRESVKAYDKLAELWTSLGVHGHVLKHGLESVAAKKTKLMMIYVKFVELSYAKFLFGNMVEEDLLDLECLQVLWKKTPHTQHQLSGTVQFVKV